MPSKLFLNDLHGGGNHNDHNPSPVNKRVGFSKVSEMNNLDSVPMKIDDYVNLQQSRANPFMHLIDKVKHRIDVFKNDTTTLQLISVKFVDLVARDE